MPGRGALPAGRAAVVLAVAALAAVTGAASADRLQVVGSSGRIPAAGLRFHTGHRGAVTHLAPWRGGAALVSAGVDGALRVWDARDGSVRHSVTLAGVPSALVVHPWLPRAYAALGGARGERLAAWDWEQEQELFSVAQSDRPLFLGLSRTATSLLVGRASFDGLRLLDAATGVRLTGPEWRTGIVTFAVTSSAERLALTYQPSGSLTYRNLASGAVDRNRRAPAGLTDIGLSRDRRYLIGRDGERLVAVDAVEGTETDRRRVAGLRLMEVWEAADRVLVIAEDEHGPMLLLLPIADGRFAGAAATARLAGTPTALAHGRDEVFVGMADGTILRLDPRGPEPEFTVLSRDERLAILDVSVAGDTIALGTEAGAVALTGGFVAGPLPRLVVGAPVEAAARVFPRPFGPDADPAVRVTALDGRRVLVWSAAEEPGIAVLTLPAARLGAPQLPLPAPLASLDVAGGAIAAVDRRGNAALLAARLDPSDPSATVLTPRLTVGLRGPVDVVAGERDGAPALIAALASVGGSGASIVSIAAATGETISAPDRRSFVYDLAYDPRARALYSLGVHAGFGSRTSLRRHGGAGLDSRRTLFAAAGEDLHASAAVERGSGRVFFSMAGRVRVWDGRGVRPLAATGREPRRLAVHAGRVYAVNADGTLSVWSADTRAHLADLRLWRDFEWLLTASGRYWTSQDGARYVRGGDADRRGSLPLRRGLTVLE